MRLFDGMQHTQRYLHNSIRITYSTEKAIHSTVINSRHNNHIYNESQQSLMCWSNVNIFRSLKLTHSSLTQGVALQQIINTFSWIVGHRLWQTFSHVSSHLSYVKHEGRLHADLKHWQAQVCKHFDGLVQERFNSSALAMELRLSWTNHRFVANNGNFGAKDAAPNHKQWTSVSLNSSRPKDPYMPQ